MRHRHRRAGQALVELAIALPLLLSLLIGVVDVGWLYHHQLVLTNAAREGARLGALGRSTDQVRADVKRYLTDAGYVPMPADGDVAVTLAGGELAVAITSRVPWLLGASGTPIALTARSRMRRED